MITLMKNIFYAHNPENGQKRISIKSSNKYNTNNLGGENAKRKKYVDPIGLKDIIRLPLIN